jgi:hypothetical protein
MSRTRMPPTLLSLVALAACDSPLAPMGGGDSGVSALPDGGMGGADADQVDSGPIEGLPIEVNPSVEAEEYSTYFAPGSSTTGHSWTIREEEGSGGRYIRALNPGENCRTSDPCDPLSQAPRVSYELKTRASGTHFLWVRGTADNADENSLHLGIDGGALVQANWNFGPAGAWTWKRSQSFELTAGVHSIDIYMREGGFSIDQLLLTADETFSPTDSHDAPPLIWQAEDAPVEVTVESDWTSFDDEGAFGGKAMRFGQGTFRCECTWSDANGNSLHEFGECSQCQVEATAAHLVFNKAYEDSNFTNPDRIWLRVRFTGAAKLHIGFVNETSGAGVLHSDLPLEGGAGSWEWRAVDVPAGPSGQPLHATALRIYGGTGGLELDEVIATTDLGFSPLTSVSP